MEQQGIIKTEVQGIEATALLQQFEALNARLSDLQERITPTDKPTLLTRQQVAEILGVSLVTVHNWTNSNVIQAYRIGNKVRFKQAEIFEALQSINARKTANNER